MGKKILIADDSTSMRTMVTYILSEEGHTVVAAIDGQDALSKFSGDVNLIITDLNMPKLNGIEFIRKIRSGIINRFVPIIMLTTESEETKKEEGRKAGATAWIVKPFTPAILLETLKKVIG